jgi:hypothetical protein
VAAQTPVEQFAETVETVRLRIEEAVERARVRAQQAGDLAVKLAYAYVGAAVIAQERVSNRFSELVNAR